MNSLFYFSPFFKVCIIKLFKICAPLKASIKIYCCSSERSKDFKIKKNGVFLSNIFFPFRDITMKPRLTATQLIRSLDTLFWSKEKPSQSFLIKKKALKCSHPVNTAIFCGPLVIGLTGFHRIYVFVLRK